TQQECQEWEERHSDDDADADEILCGIQYPADFCRHPWLDRDIEAVRTLYSVSAVSVREYGSIDDVDVDLKMNANFLDEVAAQAWRINLSEPVVIRLQFSMSQYLDGPAPSVEVFQLSNNNNFSLGKQLQNILTVFISRVWKHLANDNAVTGQKRSHSWFRPSGTIKKFCARLKHSFLKSVFDVSNLDFISVFPELLPFFFSSEYRVILFVTLLPQRVMVSAVKSSAQLNTKQLMELLFTSQAIGHCKTTPTLQHGFLVQIMRYAEQRIPTLNEYCVVCDERHVFQNGPMLKPAVCTRELCVFSFHMLGVMSGATEEVATGAEVIDLLVAMCRAALQSSRKSLIFEPYPSIVDPHNPKTLAFSPKSRSYDRLQKALDNVLLVRRMAQGPYSEIKKQLDKIDPLAHPLLQWILASNRSHIVKLPLSRQLTFMHTPHQFLLISSPPCKEAHFQTAKKLYGSTFAFHGSHIENWHSILRNGLVNASYTKLQLHGAAYGKGIYLSPISSISFGYSGKNSVSCLQVFAKHEPKLRYLFNLITSKNLQKHGNIWVCPVSDHVCTRFLFVYENGQVGDIDINTQEDKIQQEISRVIASKPC
uniref:Poly [ADP-ribose] polymerase n=1 Tax=Astatotilapia calliptera TaxID=8154 RepID=A0AAX7V349_ASTCA